MEWKKCRLCENPIVPVLNLGMIHPSDFTDFSGQVPFGPQPLVLAECTACRLVQLQHSIDPDEMYRQYWYRSALNPTMVTALKDIVESCLGRLVTSARTRVVVDIGCNDGTMLSQFPPNWDKIGFDPALNLAEDTEKYEGLRIVDYFSASKMPRKKAHIVSAIAMFYDLNYPGSFVTDVKKILHKDGIFVIQLTDLMSVLAQNAFDSICHEHVVYYTLTHLYSLLQKHGLQIFDVEQNDVNGGSIRVWACHPGKYKVSMCVGELLRREFDFFVYTHPRPTYLNPISDFVKTVEHIKARIMGFLSARELDGGIYALGASTKGNTLLQYFGVTNRQIVAIGEIHEDKFGKFTVGTNIPIISEKKLLEKNPDIIMVLPWHFRDHFIKILEDYIADGGSLLFPLPTPQLFMSGGWLDL